VEDDIAESTAPTAESDVLGLALEVLCVDGGVGDEILCDEVAFEDS
jgi:hypothetical protein